MSQIPEDIVSPLFLTLPVESLLRLRCVSKSFCAIIDSPRFIKQFLDRSLKTSSDFDVVIAKGNMLYSLKFPSVENLKIADATKLDYPFQDPKCEVFIVGSCNGILCFQTLIISTDFILWNPSTGKYRKVEAPKFLESEDCDYACYFGYDHVKDDYNVVTMSPHQGSYVMAVYSLKTDSWKKINQEFPYQTCKLDSGAFLHGAVHWLASASECKPPAEPELIVAFDLGTETFRLIPQPDRNGHQSWRMGLYDLGGRLCLVSSERNADGRCMLSLSSIWVMEDYEVEQSWVQLVVVVTHAFGHFKPFAYYPKGSTQVLGILDKDLIWCFPEKRSSTYIWVRGLRDCNPITFSGCTCFGSLVPV